MTVGSKELGIKKHIFGYSKKELERKAAGEKVFPHVFGTDMYGRDILVRVMYGARVFYVSLVYFAALLVLILVLYMVRSPVTVAVK